MVSLHESLWLGAGALILAPYAAIGAQALELSCLGFNLDSTTYHLQPFDVPLNITWIKFPCLKRK